MREPPGNEVNWICSFELNVHVRVVINFLMDISMI